MQQCGLADFAVDHRLVGLPAWLLKRQPRIAEHKKAVQLSWYCTCSDTLCKVEHYHGKAKPTDEEVAKTWALKVAELHPQCGPRSKGDQDDPSPAEALQEMARVGRAGHEREAGPEAAASRRSGAERAAGAQGDEGGRCRAQLSVRPLPA